MTTRRKMPLTKWRPTRWPRDSAAWPRRVAPGLFSEPGTASLPRPVSTATAKSPRRRLQPGGDGAGAQRLARGTAIGARWRGRDFDSAPPQWAGLVGLRPGLLRQVVPKRAVLDAGGSPPVRHEGRFTDTPPTSLMELPRHASSTSPQTAARGVLALSLVVGLARVRARAGEVGARGCRVGHVSFRDMRPVRPWFVVNPGEVTASPWASWPQPSSENNFPAAARLPRETNSFRLQVLHYVATASGAARPSPAGRITTRTHWRDLVQPEWRNHHG